ncbi:hypothetical protein WICPIJ_009526 [Wickerhamomyces pijperi]|uniref:Trafficking protein particle complex subunit n=1 Tax=Wickerhamomyces pijperi TaxID=599730 RepID=A0A9P8TCM4_WICPI|nr:hypothetical protein WICPIJ_009526 [Wickerhamomyces pijperi]
MAIQSLYIINKSGGLIYQTDFPLPTNSSTSTSTTTTTTPSLTRLTANDYLVLAGTLHGVFAIASRLTPTAVKLTKTPPPSSNILPSYNNSGLRCIETEQFNLYIYQTITGLKFMIITTPTVADLNYATDVAETAMKSCYEVYSDYVMKDPFYELGMPIRGKAFERRLWELIVGK